METWDTEGIPLVNVVSAIIRHGDRYLLTQRLPNKQCPLQWEFPGGKVETHETLLEALRREIFEELGGVVFGPVSDPAETFTVSTVFEGTPRRYRLHLFTVLDEVKAPYAISVTAAVGVGWFKFDEMEKLDLTPSNWFWWRRRKAEQLRGESR